MLARHSFVRPIWFTVNEFKITNVKKKHGDFLKAVTSTVLPHPLTIVLIPIIILCNSLLSFKLQ